MHVVCTFQFSHSHRTKLFPRWKNGSCIEAPPQQVSGQDEPVTFTFFSDISMHPDVVEKAAIVQQDIQRTVGEILKYLSAWKKKYRPLWKLQRVCFIFSSVLQHLHGHTQARARMHTHAHNTHTLIKALIHSLAGYNVGEVCTERSLMYLI